MTRCSTRCGDRRSRRARRLSRRARLPDRRSGRRHAARTHRRTSGGWSSAANTGARCHVVTDAAEQQRVWEAREAALGVTAFVRGQPEHWPGWEDSAVPPDKLGDYLRDLERAVRRARLYRRALRPFRRWRDPLPGQLRFPFASRASRTTASSCAKRRSWCTAMAARFRASMATARRGPSCCGSCTATSCCSASASSRRSGTRGTGSIPARRSSPFPIDSNLRLGLTYQPRDAARPDFGFPDDHGSFAHATTRCVGVGKCRRRQVGDEVMCPSYLATGEEKHSTRGRAHLLHEMTRGEVIARRVGQRRGRRRAVALPRLQGVQGRLPGRRRRRDLEGRVPVAPLRAQAPAAIGLFDGQDRSLGAGLRPMLRLSQMPLHEPRRRSGSAGIHSRARLPASRRSRSAIGSVSAEAEPWAAIACCCGRTRSTTISARETLIAATQLLERAGFKVALPAEPLCCGRPLYDWGFLTRPSSASNACSEVLAPDIALERRSSLSSRPAHRLSRTSCSNLFPDRSEAKRLSAQVHYIADFVADRIDRFPKFLRGGSALVQAHCHHHSVIGFGKEAAAARSARISVERPPQGCCGMAGAFGMARETFEVGRKIGERVLLPRVRQIDPDTMILADGFSCREQIETEWRPQDDAHRRAAAGADDLNEPRQQQEAAAVRAEGRPSAAAPLARRGARRFRHHRPRRDLALLSPGEPAGISRPDAAPSPRAAPSGRAGGGPRPLSSSKGGGTATAHRCRSTRRCERPRGKAGDRRK